MKNILKFKKGHIYRVLKGPYPQCTNCLLRCTGNKVAGMIEFKDYKAHCNFNRLDVWCGVPARYESEEYILLTTYLKKLREKYGSKKSGL